MDSNLNLGLVDAQYEDSSVTLDGENRVSGVLSLTGTVDADWIAAFDQSRPPDAPWKLEDAHTLSFGPIPVWEFAAHLATIRSQIKRANDSVEVERHKRARAEHLEAEERAHAYRQAIEALSNTFGRRLRPVEESPQHAA